VFGPYFPTHDDDWADSVWTDLQSCRNRSASRVPTKSAALDQRSRLEATWVGNPKPWGTVKSQFQTLGTRFGLVLLMVGFAFQLAAAVRGT